MTAFRAADILSEIIYWCGHYLTASVCSLDGHQMPLANLSELHSFLHFYCLQFFYFSG